MIGLPSPLDGIISPLGVNRASSSSLLELLQAGNGFYISTALAKRFFQDITAETDAFDGDDIAFGVDVLNGADVEETLGAELAPQDTSVLTGWNVSETAPASVTGTASGLRLQSPAGEFAAVGILVDASADYYQVDFTLEVISGNVEFRATPSEILGVGTHERSVVVQSEGLGSNIRWARTGACDAYLRNVSIKKITRTFTGLGANVIGDISTQFSEPAGVSLSADTITFSSAAVGTQPSNSGLIVDGRWYRVRFTSSLSEGAVRLRFGNAGSNDINDIGTGDTDIILQSDGNAIAFRSHGASTSGTITNLIVEELPSYHISQDTAADEPTLDVVNGALDLDGLTQDVSLDVSALATKTGLTFGCAIDAPAQTNGQLLGDEASGGNFALRFDTGATGVTNSNYGSSVVTKVDGVVLYNPSQDDLDQAAVNVGKVFLEARNVDVPDNIIIGGHLSSSRQLDGLLYAPYLTDITDSDDLDAIAAKAMSDQGITNRASETAEDVVQATGDAGLFDASDARVNGQWREHNFVPAASRGDLTTWTKATAGDTLSAGTHTPDTTNAGHDVRRNFTYTSGVEYKIKAKVSANGYDFVRVRMFFNGTGTSQVFNLATGAVGSASSNNADGTPVPGIEDLGGGEYRVSLTGREDTVGGGGNYSINAVSTDSEASFAGDGVSGVNISEVQLFRIDEGGVETEVYNSAAPEFPAQPLYLWQDDDGQTQTESDGDDVGLILDRGNGLIVTDGSPRTTSGTLVFEEPFADLSEWTESGDGGTASIVGGRARIAGGAARHRITRPFTTVAGRRYRINFEAYQGTASSLLDAQFKVGPSAFSSTILTYTSASDPNNRSVFFTATGTTTYVTLQTEEATNYTEWDNLRVEDLGAIPFWYQDAVSDRPTWDAAEGLLDFDGVSHHLIQDLSGISDRTDMYFACLVKGADTLGILLSALSASKYAIIYSDGSSSTALNSGVGSPTYFSDTSPQSWANRDDVHTTLMDGNLHLLEILGMDLSSADFDEVLFGMYGASPGSFEVDSLLMPLTPLMPDPGVIERNILRARALEMFPALSFS